MKSRQRVLSLAVTAACMALSAPAAAQQITLKLHHLLRAARRRRTRRCSSRGRRRVEKASGGKVKIELYPAMSLGGKPPAAHQPGARRRGRHRLDGERLHRRTCSRARRCSSCRSSSPTTRPRPTSRCATCSSEYLADGLQGRARDVPARARGPGASRWPTRRCASPTTSRGSKMRIPTRTGAWIIEALGAAAGVDAGARPAAGAVEEGRRRRADPVGDHPAAQAPGSHQVPDRGPRTRCASAPRPSRCR